MRDILKMHGKGIDVTVLIFYSFIDFLDTILQFTNSCSQ